MHDQQEIILFWEFTSKLTCRGEGAPTSARGTRGGRDAHGAGSAGYVQAGLGQSLCDVWAKGWADESHGQDTRCMGATTKAN